MKSAQNIKIIPMLLLLWGSAHVVAATATAKPRTTAPANVNPTSAPNEAQLKMTGTENYGKLPLNFERNEGQSLPSVRRAADIPLADWDGKPSLP